jgi:hypothetical protein
VLFFKLEAVAQRQFKVDLEWVVENSAVRA